MFKFCMLVSCWLEADTGTLLFGNVDICSFSAANSLLAPGSFDMLFFFGVSFIFIPGGQTWIKLPPDKF